MCTNNCEWPKKKRAAFKARQTPSHTDEGDRAEASVRVRVREREERAREEEKVEDKAKCERLYNFAFLIRLDCCVNVIWWGQTQTKFSAIFHGFVHISIC